MGFKRNAPGCGCGCGAAGLVCLPCILPKSDLAITWTYRRFADGCNRVLANSTLKTVSTTMVWSDTVRYYYPGTGTSGPSIPANSWSTPYETGTWLTFDGDNQGCVYWSAAMYCSNGILYLSIQTSRANRFSIGGSDTCRCQTGDATGATFAYGYSGPANSTTASNYPSDCSGPTIQFKQSDGSGATVTLPGQPSSPSDSSGGVMAQGVMSLVGFDLTTSTAPTPAPDPDVSLAMLADLCPMGAGPCGCGGGPPRLCGHPDHPAEVRRPYCLGCRARAEWETSEDLSGKDWPTGLLSR